MPLGKTFVARLNDTLDGVLIEHKDVVYEIPKEDLQSAMHAEFRTLYRLPFGEERKYCIGFDDMDRLQIVTNPDHPDHVHQTFEFRWRSRTPTYDQIIDAFTKEACVRKDLKSLDMPDWMIGFFRENRNRMEQDWPEFLAKYPAVRDGIKAILSPADTLLGEQPEKERDHLRRYLFRRLEDFLINNRSGPPVTGVDGMTAVAGQAANNLSILMTGIYTGYSNANSAVALLGPAAAELALYGLGRTRPDISSYIEDNLKQIVDHFRDKLMERRNQENPVLARKQELQNRPEVRSRRGLHR